MGIDSIGQVCVMIHSGSRGLGHQVATDALTAMEAAMARDHIAINDRQLACARIDSTEGRDYLSGMAAAANYAWVNRSSMTFLVRQAFSKVFGETPDDLDMNVVYDVSHNIAKVLPPQNFHFIFFYNKSCFACLKICPQLGAGGRTHGWRQCQEASRSSQGCNACIPSPSPAYSGGLSGCLQNFTLLR